MRQLLFCEENMKRSKKISVLRECARNKHICRCFYEYDKSYWYYYINDFNDKFVLGQEENDFELNGYTIRNLDELKKAEIKNDVCEEINRLNGVAGQIKAPEIDISSWQSIFNSLLECGEWVIVENENDEIFHIGTILKAGKNKLTMREFDADGKWQEETKIPYKEITSVSFKTRYIDNWRKYLERTKEG